MVTRIALSGIALIAALMLASGCSKADVPLAEPAAPLTPPTSLCTTRRSTDECRQPSQVEAWFRHPRLEILGVAATPGGRQGAKLMTLAVAYDGERAVFRAKWRPYSTWTPFNDPRKEILAYAVQKLFLEPHEYVVPPAVGRCIPLSTYRKLVEKDAEATFSYVDCAYGILSYWLEDVQEVEDAAEAGKIASKYGPFDERLFKSDPTYRRSVAHLNVLTYLINHGDAHGKQFLITDDHGRLSVYSVDNSMAFSPIKNPFLLIMREDWSLMHVPALPTQALARLRTLGRKQIAKLAVIEQYQNRGGQLVHVRATPPAGPMVAGMRWVGNELKVGLTETEIEQVYSRARDLVKRVEGKQLGTF